MNRTRRIISLAIALCALAFALLPAGAALPIGGRDPIRAQSAYAQDQSYHMDRYDSAITVNKDGSLDVTETLVYVYDSGRFHRGTRYWDLNRIDGITNVQLTEVTDSGPVSYQPGNYDPDNSTSGIPGTFGTTNDGNQFKVRWVYNYVSNSTKTFQLSYHAVNAVKVYPDRDEFDWYAVPADWGGSIYSSHVAVTFPAGTDTTSFKKASVPADAELTAQGNTVTWSASSGLDNGFEVGAQLPKGILDPVKPSWQPAVDRQQQYDQNTRPLVDFGMLVLALVVLVGGVLLVIMRWYSKGRDKPVKLVSDYLADPPSNLPAGLVGTLVDESSDVRDVIATVVDMGRKGNLTIREAEKGGLFGGKDFEYQQTGNKVDFQYEQMVLDALFKQGSPIRLSDLKNHFYQDLPPIYDEMYRSLVALKYFPENPKVVRGRNMGLGILLIVVSAALFFFVGLPLMGSVSSLLVLPPIALGIVGVAWAALAGAMPRKTDFGAEETAKWRAFQRYLEEMQRYTNVQAAADKFQQFLPYAVAMGVERQLINQFNSVPAAMPQWYAPYGYFPYGYYPMVTSAGQQTAAPGGGMAGSGGLPQFNPGAAVQGMSDSLASAMQGMADSFTTMVNSASSALTSAPSSSGGGGGWGGGGGGFGGGGGGGGGGGAD